MPAERSAGAIVYRNRKAVREYLLLQYAWGHWDFPKGHLEPGETEMETVRRELMEETGISRFHIIEDFRKTVKYFYVNKKKRVFKIVVFLLLETRARAVKLSHEHIDFAWLPIDAAMEQVTFKNSKNLLRKAETLLSNHPK